MSKETTTKYLIDLIVVYKIIVAKICNKIIEKINKIRNLYGIKKRKIRLVQ